MTDLSVYQTIKVEVSGARGASLADVARKSGAYGVLPTDTDAQALDKLAMAAIALNPGFQGEDGPPGNSPATNLRDYGGNPDENATANGAANSAALQQAVDADAKNLAIYSNTGGATAWRFDSPWPINALEGRVIDVDPTVVISHAADSDLIADGIIYARPTKHRLRTLGVDYISLPESSLPTDQKAIFIEPSGPDRTRWASIDCLTPGMVTPRKVAWPGSDTWVDGAFTTADAKNFRIGAEGGTYHAGFQRMVPGKRIFARPLAIGGTPLLVAVVRHTGGFIGITATTNGAGGIGLFEKRIGQAATSRALDNPVSSSHASYEGRNSEWSIGVDNWQTAVVYFNGFAVARLRTNGIIFEAGFGVYPLAAGEQAEWQDVVAARGLEGGGELISVAAFGDSRTAPRDGAWPLFARQALDLTHGIRCHRFDNFAVGGQGSQAQLQAMQAVDLTAYNDVHINIGTNDVQGQLPVATMMSNINQMANRVRDAGAMPTFSIFYLWYGQAQSGGSGQASVNYEKGAPYRSAIRRYCSDNGFGLIDETLFSGPVIGNYVNPGAALNLVGRGNPGVFDTIHPDALLNRIAGKAIARLLLANHIPMRGVEMPAYPLTNPAGISGSAVLRITSGGTVSVEGVLTDTGTAVPGADFQVATLPPFVRRAGVLEWLAMASSGDVVTIRADLPTGIVTARGLKAAGASVNLGAISFALEAA